MNQPHNDYFSDPLHRLADHCARIERSCMNMRDNIVNDHPDLIPTKLIVAELSANVAELSKVIRAVAEYVS